MPSDADILEEALTEYKCGRTLREIKEIKDKVQNTLLPLQKVINGENEIRKREHDIYH